MGSPPGHQPADLEVLMPVVADLPQAGPVADLVVGPLAAHHIELKRVCWYWQLMLQLCVL